MPCHQGCTAVLSGNKLATTCIPRHYKCIIENTNAMFPTDVALNRNWQLLGCVILSRSDSMKNH